MRSLAWRNLWRRKGRTALMVASVATVVTVSLLLFAFAGAMRRGLLETVTASTGDLIVYARQRDPRRQDDALIVDAETVTRQVSEATDGATVATVLEAPALLFAGDRSRGVQLVGVERPVALAERARARQVASGRLPARDSLDEIALPEGLAAALSASIGDTVYAYAPGGEGVGAAALRVVGFLNRAEDMVVAQTASVSLATAQMLVAPRAATRLEVYVREARAGSRARALRRLQEALAERLGSSYVIETWQQTYPDLATLLRLLTPIMAVFACMFFGMAAMLVSNTIHLSLIERVREFGIVAALGASRGVVWRLVLLETTLLVSSGAVIGGGLGALLVYALRPGFRLPFGLDRAYAAFGFPEILHASLSVGQLLLVLALTILTALAASTGPARAATDIEPAEAIRFEA